MPDLSFAEVGEILHLLQRIDGAEVTLEWGDLKVHVRRGVGPAVQEPESAGPPVSATAASFAEPAPVSSAVAEPTEDTEPQSPDSSARAVPAHWVEVRAPMVGTFYRAPKPGDPPFAGVGDVVAAGDTVGLIEVMKLFTELTSEVAGKVARVDADDATLVDYGQPLMWIEPS